MKIPTVTAGVRLATLLGCIHILHHSGASAATANAEVITSVIAAASDESPRNSEGDVVVLRDGSLLAAWSEFYGGNRDDSAGRISAKVSLDGGRTWERKRTLVENSGQQNVMSVSFLRLQSGELLLFYLEKNSPSDLDVIVRRSSDEGLHWSEPVRVTRDEGYWVMNNARVIQLSDGRLLCPTAMTERVWVKDSRFRCVFFYSDDEGRTWQRSAGGINAPKRGAMEPGVIEKDNGALLAYIRTQTGKQWTAESHDRGDTWEPSRAWTLVSPEAPATVAELPGRGDWLAVVNPQADLSQGHSGKRTPLVARVSADEGKTWSVGKPLESDPSLTYSYTSIDVANDQVLLTYYVSDESRRLSWKFKSVPAGWLPQPPAPERLDRDHLMQYRADDGTLQAVASPDDWNLRREEILRGMESVMGAFPDASKRVALNVETLEEIDVGTYVRRRVRYQSDPGMPTTAYVCIPKQVLQSNTQAPAVLCLHPTDNIKGHRVVVGLGGRENRQYAAELAERGFITIAPSYPHLADYVPNLAKLGYVSGTMKAIWDNSRALDLLESYDFVDASRGFAAMGHSLGGHNAIYTAAFDERIAVVVSSCGFDAFEDYYGGDRSKWLFGSGWCQVRYMPRLSNYREDLSRIPFDFTELLAVLAPRPVFINAPLHDGNFQWKSVDRCVRASRPIDGLLGVPERLTVVHPDCDHDFPPEIRELAYQLIGQTLR